MASSPLVMAGGDTLSIIGPIPNRKQQKKEGCDSGTVQGDTVHPVREDTVAGKKAYVATY